MIRKRERKKRLLMVFNIRETIGFSIDPAILEYVSFGLLRYEI